MWSEVHEVVLRRDRIVVLSGLAAITARDVVAVLNKNGSAHVPLGLDGGNGTALVTLAGKVTAI